MENERVEVIASVNITGGKMFALSITTTEFILNKKNVGHNNPELDAASRLLDEVVLMLHKL